METWQKKKTSKTGSRKNYTIYADCTIQKYATIPGQTGSFPAH